MARRIFGREPLVEDGRCVGRWAYAAAWLAEDRLVARDLVVARLALAAPLAVRAGIGAGKGDAERFALVSALARLPEALGGEGPLGDAAEREIETEAARLAAEGAALRSLTYRERAAFAPWYDLEGFDAGLREIGPDRQVCLRESAAAIDEALVSARGACPALRTLRLFLRASLAMDAQEAATMETAIVSAEGPVTRLSAWLAADVALLARRSLAYGAAWAGAAQAAGDALSKTLAGLSSGAMQSNGVIEALTLDPWALVYALAMTTEPEHAAAVLDCGAQAQRALRARAFKGRAQWVTQASEIDALEERLGIAVLAAYEVREGHREGGPSAGMDLLSAWGFLAKADEARSALRMATDRSVAAEAARLREAVRSAAASLEAVREAHEAAVEAARSERAAADVYPLSTPQEDANAQRGCLMGLAAGGAVMGVYLAIGIFLASGSWVERMGPLVLGVAALPVAAAMTVQIAHALRRSIRAAEAAKRRSAAEAHFTRMRRLADEEYGSTLARGRERLQEAELELAEFDRQLAMGERKVA